MADRKQFDNSCSFRDRDQNKFMEGHDRGASISIVDQSKIGWADIQITRPNDTTEVFTYYDKNSNVVDTITIVYTDNTKLDLLSVTRGAGVFE